MQVGLQRGLQRHRRRSAARRHRAPLPSSVSDRAVATRCTARPKLHMLPCQLPATAAPTLLSVSHFACPPLPARSGCPLPDPRPGHSLAVPPSHSLWRAASYIFRLARCAGCMRGCACVPLDPKPCSPNPQTLHPKAWTLNLGSRLNHTALACACSRSSSCCRWCRPRSGASRPRWPRCPRSSGPRWTARAGTAAAGGEDTNSDAESVSPREGPPAAAKDKLGGEGLRKPLLGD